MIGFIIKKIIGSKNDREVRRLRPLVAKINEIEQSLQSLPDEALAEKTRAWKERLSQIPLVRPGDENKVGEYGKPPLNPELIGAMNEILPEAFAVVKNACRRRQRPAGAGQSLNSLTPQGSSRSFPHALLRAA